jgi:adenosylmethionine-8-amino-7-oxononanoate aminotransferase
MPVNLLVLGTDTDVGKTTFSLLWLHFRGGAYWKPVETGPSDTEMIRRLAPGSVAHSPAQRFDEPVAPPLAARRAQTTVASAERIAQALPRAGGQPLLVETFGSPFSPLNDQELQIDLIRRLDMPGVLVSSTTLGAIGRTLQTLEALAFHGIRPKAIVLLGDPDPFAEETLRRRWPSEASGSEAVFALVPPAEWTPAGLAHASREQRGVLEKLNSCLLARPERVNADLLARDRRAVWHPYTPLRTNAAPLPVVAAQDEFLQLADGRRVIDGISSWWTILHGHRHPLLMQALREASRQIDHVLFAGATHPWAVELAERLLQTSPWPDGRVFYSDNGSTAVEVALKMAYQYWRHRGKSKRTRFVGFEHGYHGDTFGAMAVSRDPVFFGAFEPLLFKADIVPLDPTALEEHLRRHRDQIAAVIVEPLVQGAGGMRMHTLETLRQLAICAHEHDVLLIADEVMTGGGRTGTLWAHQAAAIRPDLICAAKTLAGGVLPLAATLVAPHIADAFDTADRTKTFFHGHSFTAHPLACAVALANWKILTEQPLTAPTRVERFWTTALAQLRNHPKVQDVRIHGTIAAVELDVPGGYLAEAGAKMREICLEHGVLLRPLGSVIYALPPFCTSDDSLQRIADAMSAAVDGVQ